MDKEIRELVKQAQKEPEAFGILFDLYNPKIFKYCLARTAHLQAAQDITAETFFKAYKYLWRFRWQGRPFSAWLYRIATNEINRYFEKGRKVPLPAAFMEDREDASLSFPSPEADIMLLEEEIVQRQDLKKLYRTVQTLPVKYQEILALKYFEEKSILEICQILGKKEGTVKSLVSRGLDMLEKKMQPTTPVGVIRVERKIINSKQRHEQAGN